MTDDTDSDGLAAEYVLGSLQPAERADVTARLSTDARLAAAVSSWERRLAPLGHREPGLAPPPGTLAAILAGIAQQSAAGRRGDTIVALGRQTRFWRRTALAMAAALALLAIGLGVLFPGWLSGGPGTLVAVLERQSSNPAADEPETLSGPVFLATMREGSRTLDIRQIAGRRPPAGKRYAIWSTEPGATGAVLLGSLDNNKRSATLQLPARSSDALASRSLAVSIESDGEIRAPSSVFVSVGKFADK